MNILVLTKDAKHQEEVFTQDLLDLILKKVDGICQFKRHEYNDDSAKLYRAIDRNDVQVIFIDADQHGEIADEILREYGRNCPDLVGFSSISEHGPNGQKVKDISRDYDYVHIKCECIKYNKDKRLSNHLFNHLSRRVARYKKKSGNLGLITRNLNGFFLNNKSITTPLSDRELRFLTVLFKKKNIDNNCAKRADFCAEFDEFKDATYVPGSDKRNCTAINEKTGNYMLNDMLKNLIFRLNEKLDKEAEEEGFKLEGHNKYKRLIEGEGVGVEREWCYRNKIEASKKDICND